MISSSTTATVACQILLTSTLITVKEVNFDLILQILWNYRLPQNWKFGKSILQVPDTGTRVLDNTRPFLHSSIVNVWLTPTRSKERKYYIFRQYWYTRNVPVFTNTGTFQYLGPEVYFFRKFYIDSNGKFSILAKLSARKNGNNFQFVK